jgi:hypothetical protein
MWADQAKGLSHAEYHSATTTSRHDLSRGTLIVPADERYGKSDPAGDC